MTNDIDNIASTLQQSFTQIITSVLTVLGVLVMMFTISWLLALISLLTVPLSIVVTVMIMRRSQKQFAAQWEHTGILNGHVEEMHTGRAIVKVFGHEARVDRASSTPRTRSCSRPASRRSSSPASSSLR